MMRAVSGWSGYRQGHTGFGGMPAYAVTGLMGRHTQRFRGRWAARNAAFADLMVRTDLRLTEQASLTVHEIPRRAGMGGYQRFWLPGAIAKNASARWIYVPDSAVRDLAAYAGLDRAEVEAGARAAGRYRQVRRPLVIDDPERPDLAFVTGSARQPGEREAAQPCRTAAAARRRRERAGTGDVLGWVRSGWPARQSPTWKSMFAAANKRCADQGAAVSCHAHMLRHTFAVVTLEQLQRGHIAALAELSADQRGHYTRIFGDPLDWVRRRLGSPVGAHDGYLPACLAGTGDGDADGARSRCMGGPEGHPAAAHRR